VQVVHNGLYLHFLHFGWPTSVWAVWENEQMNCLKICLENKPTWS